MKCTKVTYFITLFTQEYNCMLKCYPLMPGKHKAVTMHSICCKSVNKTSYQKRKLLRNKIL